MSDPVKVLIVDDDRNESESLADLLNKSGSDLVCTAVQPHGSVEATAKLIREQLDTNTPRLLLLDYRLADHQTANGEVADFRGGTVASHVRDEDPDLPIVLLTSEEKLHKWVERRPGMRQHFDWTLLKSSVAAKDRGVRAHGYLVDFARTWQRACGWPDDEQETWRRLGELMSAPPEGLEQFVALEPKPPRGDVAGEIMHWLLTRAHRLRGPLIDDDSARVVLGVTRESFEISAVQRWLQPARYEGGLQAFGRRWWTHLVGDKLVEACGGARAIEASERVRRLGETLNVDLQVERCAWCEGERTLHACSLCKRATDAAHCLTPLGEPLPAWADPQVVCYRCVAEGRAAQERFPPSAREIVAELIEDRIQPLA